MPLIPWAEWLPDQPNVNTPALVTAKNVYPRTGGSYGPLAGLAADRAWMPAFPGITNTASPRDWEAGLPLDLKRIRPQDDRYWEEHRGTPKAFLAPAAARELWTTAWGTHTAFRVPGPRERQAELESALLRELRPALGQLTVREFAAAADVVLVIRVAAVDDDVAGGEHVGERGDRVFRDLAVGQHDPDGFGRAGQLAHEVFQIRGLGGAVGAHRPDRAVRTNSHRGCVGRDPSWA